jgi:hypothetical protein
VASLYAVPSLDNQAESGYVGHPEREEAAVTEHKEDNATLALALFLDRIRDPVVRKNFAASPEDGLQQIFAGNEALKQALPQHVKSFLEGLSDEELRVVSTLNTTLVNAGMAIDTGDNRAHTIGKL